MILRFWRLKIFLSNMDKIAYLLMICITITGPGIITLFYPFSVFGYAALLEQVVPELGLRKKKRSGREILEEARLDVEFFGHAYASDRLLDGTVRHPAAEHVLTKAAQEVGAAARSGVEDKAKRYPPRAGKAVIACAMETWGYMEAGLDDLLSDLAVLATHRQRD